MFRWIFDNNLKIKVFEKIKKIINKIDPAVLNSVDISNILKRQEESNLRRDFDALLGVCKINEKEMWVIQIKNTSNGILSIFCIDKPIILDVNWIEFENVKTRSKEVVKYENVIRFFRYTKNN